VSPNEKKGLSWAWAPLSLTVGANEKMRSSAQVGSKALKLIPKLELVLV